MHDNIQKHGVSVFTGIDADDSGSLSADELLCRHLPHLARSSGWHLAKAVLVDLFVKHGLSWPTNLNQAGKDTDQSGNIEFSEYAAVLKFVEKWTAIFKHFDKERSDIPVYLVQKFEEKYGES